MTKRSLRDELRERASDQTPGFDVFDAEQSQTGFSKVIDILFGDALGVTLMESQEAEESASHRAQSYFGVRNAESAGRLASTNVPEGTRRQSSRRVKEIKANSGDEGGD